jgi:hypothetical protein
MSSIIEGYNYDFFISYRQKANRYDGWVGTDNSVASKHTALFKTRKNCPDPGSPEGSGSVPIRSSKKC